MPLFSRPPKSQRQTEERLKLLASGFQLFALAIVTADYIAPLFHASPGASPTPSAIAAIGAGLAESAAYLLLRYIPATAAPPPSQETTHA